MAPSAQAHHRSHSLLLLQKLLNLRDSASPLTLVCDSIEQSARPLIREVLIRAKAARSKIIFISLSTVTKPPTADIFIKARGKSLQALAAEITSHLTPPTKDISPTTKTLIILDTINPLTTPLLLPLLPAFLTSLLPSPSTSLITVYHTDVPSPSSSHPVSEYTPPALTLLTHLATTVFRVSSLSHAIASHRAQSRSLPVPEFGLHEGREGVLVGLTTRKEGEEGVVVDMEMRRRSGRAVAERFVLAPGGNFMLLSDHSVFARPAGGGEERGEDEGGETTFSLGLTDKQRRDREGVVLPYFDAQTEVGGGEGGRILYDMGREDDFDEEEDEI